MRPSPSYVSLVGKIEYHVVESEFVQDWILSGLTVAYDASIEGEFAVQDIGAWFQGFQQLRLGRGGEPPEFLPGCGKRGRWFKRKFIDIDPNYPLPQNLHTD
jgi:hypothetical protein